MYLHPVLFRCFYSILKAIYPRSLLSYLKGMRVINPQLLIIRSLRGSFWFAHPLFSFSFPVRNISDQLQHPSRASESVTGNRHLTQNVIHETPDVTSIMWLIMWLIIWLITWLIRDLSIDSSCDSSAKVPNTCNVRLIIPGAWLPLQANPKDADQIFSAIDWRVQQLKVQDHKSSGTGDSSQVDSTSRDDEGHGAEKRSATDDSSEETAAPTKKVRSASQIYSTEPILLRN